MRARRPGGARAGAASHARVAEGAIKGEQRQRVVARERLDQLQVGRARYARAVAALVGAQRRDCARARTQGCDGWGIPWQPEDWGSLTGDTAAHGGGRHACGRHGRAQQRHACGRHGRARQRQPMHRCRAASRTARALTAPDEEEHARAGERRTSYEPLLCAAPFHRVDASL
eukprot:1068586-Prymnesium_polylepis.1